MFRDGQKCSHPIRPFECKFGQGSDMFSSWDDQGHCYSSLRMASFRVFVSKVYRRDASLIFGREEYEDAYE